MTHDPPLVSANQASSNGLIARLLYRKMQRYITDIAALCETRLVGIGEVAEAGAGYTFFWNVKAKEELKEAGVGFAIRTKLDSNFECKPRSINDRLVVMRPSLCGQSNLTNISAYPPTLTYDLDEKELFYQKLGNVLRSVPKDDKHIVAGRLQCPIRS